MDAMELTNEDRASLEALLRPAGYDGSVSARAQMVLWQADGRSVAEIAQMSGTSKQTVYTWLGRYQVYGVDGLVSRVPTGRPRDISDEVRSQILALSQQTPPDETGLSHWSSREMARYLKQRLGISVSHNFVASLWREHDLQPHRQRNV
ncbi:MAG: helix-turn-helix domain-containing protein [Pseudonocardia sp.]|nr:helix-turn-helix domain-containing protein [Pseudonocardia sp.]